MSSRLRAIPSIFLVSFIAALALLSTTSCQTELELGDALFHCQSDDDCLAPHRCLERYDGQKLCAVEEGFVFPETCEERPNQDCECADGVCEYTCQAGWADLDGDAATGCECSTEVDAVHFPKCNAIYVSFDGDDENEGLHPDSPLQTLDLAIERSAEEESHFILLATNPGATPYSLGRIIDRPLSIIGGLDPGDLWRPAAGERSIIEDGPSSAGDGGPLASTMVLDFSALDEDAPSQEMLLANLNLRAPATPSEPGASVATLRLHDVGLGVLTVLESTIHGGTGADGANGVQSEEYAGVGIGGVVGTQPTSPFGAYQEVSLAGGFGGGFDCSFDDRRRPGAGGNGGASLSISIDLINSAAGEDGEAPLQVPVGSHVGRGGLAGIHYYDFTDSTAQNGGSGSAGSPGSNGSGGIAPTQESVLVGSFDAQLNWAPALSTAGEHGYGGFGGGGGGGGGTTGRASESSSPGVPGSGGGGGGCGGAGGEGGRGGGASFAILLFDAEILLDESVDILIGRGGAGGDGAPPICGGHGGKGGAAVESLSSLQAGSGGAGGDGGAGGHGGGGAGGVGGPGIGIALVGDSNATHRPSSIIPSDISLPAGGIGGVIETTCEFGDATEPGGNAPEGLERAVVNF